MSSSAASVDDGISLRLQGGPEAAARARRALSKLRADIDPPLMETLRLLVTELVSNSVRHAQADTVVLKVLVGRSAVLTEVTDEGPGLRPGRDRRRPARRAAAGACSSSSGSPHRWGVNQHDDATRVWFELLALAVRA